MLQSLRSYYNMKTLMMVVIMNDGVTEYYYLDY